MVSVVFQDEFLPRQREEVCEWVSQEFLPVIHWESGAVHHVVVDVDVLDSDVGKRDAEHQCASPPIIREECQCGTVAADHEALSHKDQCQDVPHVHHLLWGDLCEQECQVLWHWIWFVCGGEQAVGLQTPVFVVLLHLQHLIHALPDTSSVSVAITGQDVLQRCNLVVMLVLFLQLLKVLISPVEDGSLRMATSLLATFEQWSTACHDSCASGKS